jgi:cell division protease FtsH
MWYGLFLLLFGVMFGGQYWLSRPSVQQLSYSEFKAALRQGYMQKVQIGTDRIRGTHLVPREQRPNGSIDAAVSMHPVSFMTIRVDDPDLIRDLDAHQVLYTGQPEGGWFSTLLW